MGRLLAVSGPHNGYAGNRSVVDRLRPGSADDWLIVAGDAARHPACGQWCGTERAVDRRLRFRAKVPVYGYFPIALTVRDDRGRSPEVSLGCPRGWRR